GVKGIPRLPYLRTTFRPLLRTTASTAHRIPSSPAYLKTRFAAIRITVCTALKTAGYPYHQVALSPSSLGSGPPHKRSYGPPYTRLYASARSEERRVGKEC